MPARSYEAPLASATPGVDLEDLPGVLVDPVDQLEMLAEQGVEAGHVVWMPLPVLIEGGGLQHDVVRVASKPLLHLFPSPQAALLDGDAVLDEGVGIRGVDLAQVRPDARQVERHRIAPEEDLGARLHHAAE